MREWKRALNRLETRHRIATDLDRSLPAAATDGLLKGARVAREGYSYTADGDGRRYANGDHWVDDDGKWRYVTAQGMPADLRTKLLGWRFADKDGRKSDLTIYVIVANLLGLRRSNVDILVDEYLKTDEVCRAWLDGVAEHHGTSPEVVKRWPNILGNGGSYETCLTGAGLPLDSPRDARVERMETQLKKLRLTIVKSSCAKPNALWEGSERFVERHDARLQHERPDLKDHERFNKIFSYLVQTAEDRLLRIHAQAQRAARRDALGRAKFDALPPELRDTGALCFDGLATERAGDDPGAGDRAAEAAFVNAGWHAQSWGIEYKIVEKSMFGEQRADPDDFDSAKGARRALQEAAAAYPEVQQAVDTPSMHRRRASSVVSGNASVIPVSNGRALLTIEVREGVAEQKYGLFGGKAEPGEALAQTAALEAFEQSGHMLSDATSNAIAQLEPVAFKECRAASMHIAVVPVGTEDAAAPSRFVEANANRAGSSTKHVGIEWVDIAKLLDHLWRKRNMHQGVMVAAVRETLRKHVVTGDAVCGEKRSRDLFSDLDDDAMADALDAAMAERYPKRSRVNTLESVVSGNAACGEKRSRDSFSDLEDDTELDAVMAGAEGLV
jgi:8-oxo-dGTP pyrophosphatase MutT (NUDIX family)